MAYSFSSAELAAMQAAQDAHMQDQCAIGRYTDGGTDDYGAPIPTWPQDEPIACGFNVSKVDEVLGAANVPDADAAVRLPIGTTLDARDRVVITQRFGVAVDEVAYNIIGTPQRGPSGLVVALQRVANQ